MTKRTLDGLPVVTEETLKKVLGKYNRASAKNYMKIIEKENPQIYLIFKLGVQQATSKRAGESLEFGILSCYELLRRQSSTLKNSR